MRMRSEGYCSRPVCQSVCPGLFSATHATTRSSRHTYGLSIVLAPDRIWRFSYNGLVSKIAIALPYSRAHGSRPFLYARIFTRAETFRLLYAHAYRIPPRVLHFSVFIVLCVCVCVRGPHLRLAQLSDKLDILVVSV